MVAFCRYLDGPHERLAVCESLWQEKLSRSNGDNTNATGRCCPIAELVDENFERRLIASNSLFELDARQLQQIPTPEEHQWRDLPATLLPPVRQPEKIFCIGLNYLDHAIETGAEPPTLPVVFSKFNSSLIGHGHDIVLPKISDRVDYEAELVVVIGKTAKHVSESDAMHCVFGYTAGHDVSSRDWQKGRPGGQWLVGKTFDTFAPIGPCVVTQDEINDPSAIPVEFRLNGETMQSSSTQQLIFSIPQLIAHLSQFTTLRPGDLIFTGTPPGVGAARTPPRFLQPGDECEVHIKPIGTLRNRCVAESQ